MGDFKNSMLVSRFCEYMYIRTLKTIFFMSYRAGSVVVWIIAVIVVAVNIYFIISTVVGLFKSILVRKSTCIWMYNYRLNCDIL